MNPDDLKQVLADHALWWRGKGGKRANLAGAYLARANLAGANLARANLAGADLARADLARADLARANLAGANLARAVLTDAYLADANLAGANLARANLARADLARANLAGANLARAVLNSCIGNMREIKSMQIDKWPVTYTADTLQIGCQSHPIDKWRKWDADAGRKWIAQMDGEALDWADRHLALILSMIDANPATPTGHEKPASEAA